MKLLAFVCAGFLALAGCGFLPTDDSQPPADADFSRYVIVTVRNDPAPAPPRAGSSVRSYAGPANYTVAPATRSIARAIAATHGLRETSAWPIGLLGVHCVVFQLPPGISAEEMLARLRRDGRVESAQPLQSFMTLTPEPGDPYRNLQRNLDVMQVADAHAWSRGEGVRIAVIDTGVDASHPDLAGRIVRQQNLVGDGQQKTTLDRHGTAVAGVIAAVENNSRGIIGVAPAAQLYALRACWPRPDDDSRAYCSSFTLAKALAAAIDAHMHIVNLSLGGPADPLLTRIIEAGLKRGIVFVGATPPTDPRRSFPVNINGVLAANASGADGVAESTLFAPGRDVLTLAPGGRYDFMSGSSLAAASISGGVALLLARDRTLQADDARDLLARSTRHVSTDAGDVASVNLCIALSSLLHEPVCER
ncbi:MAG: S8 family peptidase [Steroidobacter sp.]